MPEIELATWAEPPPDLTSGYDAQARLLTVRILTEPHWPYGIDLDGLVIVDLTAARAVANFDVLMPRERWAIGLPFEPVAPRSSAKAARVIFSQAVVAEKSLVEPVAVYASSDRRTVQIVVGSPSKPRFVPLTRSCDVLVEGQILAGFQVRL